MQTLVKAREQPHAYEYRKVTGTFSFYIRPFLLEYGGAGVGSEDVSLDTQGRTGPVWLTDAHRP